MKEKNVLLVPASFPKTAMVKLLTPFFQTLVTFVPTEDDLHNDKHTDLAMEIQSIAPAPLGNRLENFKRMMVDVKAWASQIGAGHDLHFENIIAMLEQQNQSESLQKIVLDIKGRKENRVLAVARLFQKLSIESDIQQDEIEKELSKSISPEKRIENILGGLADEELNNNPELQNLKTNDDRYALELSMPRQRIRSWTAIASKYEEKKPLKAIPLGQGMGIKDILDIAFEAMAPKEKIPLELLRLRLPEKETEKLFDNSFNAMWDNFMDTAMSGPWNSSQIELKAGKIQRAWDRRMEKFKPANRTLYLTSYPRVSLMSLLKKASGFNEKLHTDFLAKELNISFFLI